jgi:hypothetical protein
MQVSLLRATQQHYQVEDLLEPAQEGTSSNESKYPKRSVQAEEVRVLGRKIDISRRFSILFFYEKLHSFYGL